MIFTRLYWRMHQNFLMGDRLREYRDLLLDAKDQGYTFLTITEFAEIARGALRPPSLAFVLRNDVDSDVSTARLMFETERSLGVKATYYFRLSTLDADLMHDMQSHGTEVGYHFEEVATVAKRLGLRNSCEVEGNLKLIRGEFRKNMELYKEVAGTFPKTVASHGDFCNRMIGVTNCCIVDENIRNEFGIVAEAYDAWLNNSVTLRLSDIDAPKWWSPIPLSAALARQPACLYVLVHPRQWRANLQENLQAEGIRIGQGLRFSIARIMNASNSQLGISRRR